MMSLYTIALLLLTVTPFARSASCHFNSMGNKLLPQSKGGKSKSCIERGEGICSGEWGFGLTESGELRLYKGGKWEWDSGKGKIDFCNMNEGGGFACYKGSCYNPKGKAIYALNCGGKDGSYMKIDEGQNKVVKKRKDTYSWALEKNGKEVGSCVD